MEKLKGIIVPMVTPLKENGAIDFESAGRIVRHLLSGGVHGIFVLGTTGEAQCLTVSEKADLIEAVGREIGGKVPYIAGVTDASLGNVLELSRIAENAGACGVVSTPPYYYTPSQSEIRTWFLSIAELQGLPVYMYNMPSHVKVSIEPETVASLASHPNIRGLKDSSHNMTYFQTLSYLTREEKDFSLYVGPEEQTAQAVLLGAAGGVNGGANMFPELYVNIYNAALSSDLDTVRRLQKIILRISAEVYSVGGYLSGLKAAMEVLGLCGRTLARPYSSLEASRIGEMRSVIEGITKENWK